MLEERDRAWLIKRMGEYHLNQRIRREGEKQPDPYRRRHIEEILPVASILKGTLKVLQLWPRGVANTSRFEISENKVELQELPIGFEGYTILQLSDLHLRGRGEHLDALLKAIESLEYDLVVLTGDYSPGFADSTELKAAMTDLRSVLKTEVYAILGNHDSIEMVPWLAKLDIAVLLNEGATISHAGDEIYLAGVDDYHRFRLSNIERALSGRGRRMTVLLNHSPEQYRQAAYADVQLYLAGHTHGGQICLPNGFAPKMNIECSRRVGSGAWQFDTMIGYTSRGVGASLVNVRFNCPPELVLHKLATVS